VLTNPRSDRVKAVRALSRRSVRSRTGEFLAEGPQAVREAVAFRPELVRDVYVTPEAAERHPAIVEAARSAELWVHEVTSEVLAAMCDTESPQGIAAVCRVLDVPLDALLAALPPDALVCVLTNVRDPGNAGTVIRTADAAGADAVILTRRSTDPYSGKCVRSSAGSIFHLPVVTGVDARMSIETLRTAGLTVLATTTSGDPLDAVEETLAGPTAWVFGNEAHGLPEDVVAAADRQVRVSIHGRAESLNLAAAAAVCLYASARAQRP
jgi:RNA methyltransferase, TrmH family